MNNSSDLLVFLFLAVPLSVGLVVFLGLQFLLLQGVNRRRSRPLGKAALLGRACIGVIVGSAIGLAAGYAVLMGPSHLSGDFIGLPWLTMLLALPVAGVVALLVSQLLSRRLVLRAVL
jgi:hypothetical protein